jgi:hypothetical protein
LDGKINPRGLAFLGGIKYRNSYHYDAKYDAVSSYWETGIDIGVTPAFMQAGVHAEWMPWLFLQMRAQYDYMEYTGINDGLLSNNNPQIRSFAEGKKMVGSMESFKYGPC